MHRESEEFRQGVSARMASGATWTVGIRLCERLIGVLSLVILARLLVPDDFGLLALATTLVAAIELLGSFSFDLWLINQSRHSRADLDTVWTLGILRGLIAALVLALLAGPAALFFDAPRIHDIVLVLALGSVVMGFENAGVILFRKELEFDRDFRLVVTTKLTGFVVTIVTAFALRSYWALVIGVMTAKVARVVLSYLMHPHRPRPSLERWREVMGFSKWLLGANLVGFLYRRAHTFVVGHILGADALGRYTMAYEISNLATSELVMPVRRVAFSGYAKLGSDPEGLRRSFVDVLALTWMIAVPTALGIALVAEPLVRVALGEKWAPIVPLVQVLALFGLASAAIANVPPALVAVRRVPAVMKLSLLATCLLVPLLIVGAHVGGAAGVAWAAAGTNAIYAVACVALAVRALEVDWRRIAHATWRTIASAALLALSVTELGRALPGGDDWSEAALELLALVGAGSATYAGSHIALWFLAGRPNGPEAQALRMVRALARAGRRGGDQKEPESFRA